jgi:tetratricopeptide (TPR) repeat protein
VAISKEFGYANGLAFSLSGLSGIVRDVGAYQEARQLYQETLAAYKMWGDTSGMSWCLAMLGYIAMLLGEPLEAETRLQESLAVCHEIGAKVEPWWYHCVQGELALVQGAYPRAAEHFQKSMTLFKDVGDIGVLWGIAWSLNGLGKTACALGAYQESRQYFQKALRSAMHAPSIPEALDILVGMAILLAASGKKEQAMELSAIPLHHPASRQITRERVARLLAELGVELTLEQVEATQARAQARTFEAVVQELLSHN